MVLLGMPPADRELALSEPVPLCDAHGRLHPGAVGWSRQPLCRAALPRGWPRRKRWHHWCVTSPAEVVALTFGDVDYLGIGALFHLDLGTGRAIRRTTVRPGGWPGGVPDDARTGRVTVDGLGLSLDLQADPGGVSLRGRARGLAVDLRVTRPPGHESLSVVIPWSATRFAFTTKENTLPASGTLELGGRTRSLADGAFACLDFGRGLWPYRTSWNWAAASGRQGDRVVGLNLGARWTDGTGLDENALTVDGRLEPIEGGVRFAFDPRDLHAPWRIHGPAVELELRPVFAQRLRLPLLVASADLAMVFGHITGRVLGRPIEHLFGWAEELFARW